MQVATEGGLALPGTVTEGLAGHRHRTGDGWRQRRVLGVGVRVAVLGEKDQLFLPVARSCPLTPALCQPSLSLFLPFPEPPREGWGSRPPGTSQDPECTAQAPSQQAPALPHSARPGGPGGPATERQPRPPGLPVVSRWWMSPGLPYLPRAETVWTPSLLRQPCRGPRQGHHPRTRPSCNHLASGQSPPHCGPMTFLLPEQTLPHHRVPLPSAHYRPHPSWCQLQRSPEASPAPSSLFCFSSFASLKFSLVLILGLLPLKCELLVGGGAPPSLLPVTGFVGATQSLNGPEGQQGEC